MSFDLKRLLTGVFEIQPGEKVVVACDIPHDALADHPLWRDRREMATEWTAAFKALAQSGGFSILPLLEYAATGAQGSNIPVMGMLGGEPVNMETVLLEGDIIVIRDGEYVGF